MLSSFNGNICITIIFCNSHANIRDETEIIFYKLSSLVQHIPKLNILIIGRDINAQKG